MIAGVIAAAFYLLMLWPLRDPHPAVRLPSGTLALTGAKIYPSPDAPAIEQGTVLVRDGLIAAIGAGIAVPPEAQVISCNGRIVTAGFWNAHVHFTEPKWSGAAWKSAATLDAQLADMLTSRGFTTVVDTGSDPRWTISLRRRIEAGELRGPALYAAGSSVFPPKGVPYYLKSDLPTPLIWLLPQPSTPTEAARIAGSNIERGGDLLKLFTGSYIARGKVLPMAEDIARAAVDVAHRHGQLVYAHPSDLAGTQVAINSGVDVLAHAPDTTEGIDRSLLASMIARRMAMIPTLKMFATTVTKAPGYLLPIYAIVRQFHELGGQLLFGTDAGYMTDYTTVDEFRALAQSGQNARDILRMLTTAPAARFGITAAKGRVEPGKRADLVVLDRDPDHDMGAFEEVRMTVRNGVVLYRRP